MTVTEQIMAALTSEPLTSREVWRKIDCWAEQTISNYLNRLAAEGALVRERRPIPTGFVWTYRREKD